MEKCDFCDRKMFAERLVGEDNNFYVVASLGQITNGGYLLIVPKEHYSCIGAMPAAEAGKVAALADRVQTVFRRHYDTAGTEFEHGIKEQSVLHAHLHLVPAVLNFSPRIERDFPLCEKDTLISIRDLPRSYAIGNHPYLFWRTPGGPPSVCYVDSVEVPKMYLRVVAAELLGRPERSDWKKMDPELDKKLWSDTVRRLKRYFP